LLVVLVSPRNPLNVGAAARALANFGCTRLTVVSPYAPHWREAQSAVGAPHVLENATVCATLAEAVSGCTLVIGTGTLSHRKAEQSVVLLPDLAGPVRNELQRGGSVALVFGPEKHGLTRDDLSWCHLLVEIPTDPLQPSMNLGQAVAVCLYELSTRAFPACDGSPAQTSIPCQPSPARNKTTPAAPSGNLDLLAGVIEQTMAAAGYSPASMHSANQHDLRLLLRRLAPNVRDSRRILGLFRRVLWRLQNGSKRD
jgi:tRNA/rRNA methyltransferase